MPNVREQDDILGSERKSKIGQVTGHKAFPLVVALWFTVLLGIGSLVVPGALVERIVTVTGLPQLIAAAAPPLGWTARIAIALLSALAGAVLGLFVGRQAYRASHAQKHAVSPINAREELGEDGLDGPNEPAARRRFINTAGEDDADAAQREEDPSQTDIAAADNEDAALHLAQWGEEVAPEQEPAPSPQLDDAPEGDDIALDDSADSAAHALVLEAEPEADEVSGENTASGDSLDDLSLMQLARRLQDAIAKRRDVRSPLAAPAPAAMAAQTVVTDTRPAGPAPEDDASETPARAPQSVHDPITRPFIETDDLVIDGRDDDDDSAFDDSYTSLLAMTASVRAVAEHHREDRGENSSGEADAASRQSASPYPAATIGADTSAASTLAELDRAGGNHGAASKPVRAVDPEEQALRDALMNLSRLSK